MDRSFIDLHSDNNLTLSQTKQFSLSLPAKWKRWVVMVVDEETLRIVSNVIGMYDLMENRVTLVDSLEKKRAPFHDMAVVYLVAPTESSVNHIIDDWKNAPLRRPPGAPPPLPPEPDELGRLPPPKKQLYADAVFLYFLNHVPNELFDKIKKCTPLATRVRALGEINIDFLAKEERSFHMDMKVSSVLRNLYGSQRSASNIQEQIIKKLVTVCATLNEYPHIRYSVDSPLSQAIAMAFHDKMKAFIANNSAWWYHGDTRHNARDRSTMLILDRQYDVLSPLMHEFTYQAMVNDLLKIKDDKITYKADTVAEDGETEVKQDKEVLLNDNDELWIELRGKHIADVIQNLSTRIRDIVNSNSGAAYTKDTGKNLSMDQMASALKSLPEYRETMSKLSQHMYLAHQCMEIFNKQNLLDLSDLEQTLATGQDDEGRHPKLSELIANVKETLPNLTSSVQKIRLLAILIVSQKKNLKESDMDNLYAESGLKEENIQILKNLEGLGIIIGEGESTSTTAMLGNMIR